MAKHIARRLNRELGVGAVQAYYLHKGTWFEPLTDFPGALFDLNGYVRFDTREEYERCPSVSHRKKLNVRGGISSIAGYVRDERIEGIVRSMGS